MSDWRTEAQAAWASYNAGKGPRPEPRHDAAQEMASLGASALRDIDGRPMWHRVEPALHEDLPIKQSAVEHPPHYTWHPSGVEAIAIIEEFPHNLAAAMGYIWRADHKGRFREDIEKAIWHLRRELARREKAK